MNTRHRSVNSNDTTTAAHADSPAAAPRKATTRGRRIAACALPVAMAAVVPFALSDYWIFVAAQLVIFAIATLGLDIVFGRTGQLSLAHACFMGLGAYVTVVAAEHGIPVIGQFALVVAAALVSGAVVAIPTLRLSGLRLALVTLLFGELFVWAINHTTELTGGSQGATAEPIIMGTFDTSLPVHAYLLVLVFAVLATAATLQLSRTQLGRRMLAVRDSELAARSAGINVVRTKIVSCCLAAVFAGVAGWLYAAVVGFVSPTAFDLFPSVYFLVAVLLGGAGTVVGAWLGAAYIVLVPQAFNLIGQPNLFPVLGGAVLVVVALLLPDGLVSLPKEFGSGGRLAGVLHRRAATQNKNAVPPNPMVDTGAGEGSTQ